MAGPSPLTTSDRNRILQTYAVNPEKEAELMNRYTKMFTRELVFAVDLMTHVMKLSDLRFQNIVYANCYGSRGPSDFDDVMKRFVERLLAYRLKAGAKLAMEGNLKVDSVGYEELKSFVNASAIRTEALPYGAYPFLVFCILMAEMCTIAYQRGLRRAPDFGIMLICRTYSNFDYKCALPSNSWEGIKLTARNKLELLEHAVRLAE